MKISLKAALFSALVFPGAGHYILKRYYAAAGLAFVSSIALYSIVASAYEKASIISNKILSGEIQLDIAVIVDLVKKQTEAGDYLQTQIATTVIMITWVIAVIDSYRVGRQCDKTNMESV